MRKRVLTATVLALIVASTFGLLLITESQGPTQQSLVWLHTRFPRLGKLRGPPGIPKILHQVYLDGEESLNQTERNGGARSGSRFPTYNRSWSESCKKLHPDWKYEFWNLSRADHLLQTDYPRFLPTFQSYETMV